MTYRINYPKATLKIFSTGSITITAPCVANIQSAVEHIYPLVHRFRKPKTPEDIRIGANVPKPLAANDNPSARGRKRKFSGGEDLEYDSNLDDQEEDYDSEND